MKSRYMNEQEKIEIINFHKNGLNTVEISKIVNRSQTGIERFLKSKGYEMQSKKRITEVQLKDIKEKYINGKTCKQIYEDYKHIYKSEAAIQKIIRNMGISRGLYKKDVVLNHNYFENIDTERKAYWLGFLLADGCVLENDKKSDKIKLELKISDKYIVEEFAKDIETDLKVLDYKYGYKHNCQMSISSNKMSSDLSKYGIIPRKTLKICKIPIIKDVFMRHFIRGYFDGDGCITLTKPKDQKIHRATAYFCGTELFLNDLNKYISNKLQIGYKKLIDMNKYGHNVFNLRYNNNIEIYKFYNYLYEDCSICLKRKKEKFEIFINERKK